MKTIGNKIKELRRSKGMSQKDIADKLGVTSQAVSKWENDGSLPEMTMLPDIASLFGIQIDDLFEYSTEKRYESIEKKLQYGRVMTNMEFENEEAFLIREVEADPTNYHAISLLGDFYGHRAECMYQKSVYYAKRAIDLHPNQKGDINNINNGNHGKRFDWDTANHQELIRYWYKLLKTAPENTRVYFYLLDNLIDDGRIEEAKTVLKESYQKNPDELNAFYEVFIKEKQVGFEAVKAEYEALAKANENSWRILFSIANVFSYNEYFKEAIQMWQKTFDCMPKPRYTDSFEAMAQCCVITMGIKARHPHLPFGNITFAAALAVILLNGAVFQDVDSIIYGIMFNFIVSAVINKMMFGFSSSMLAMIVTDDGKAACAEIDRVADRGSTILQGHGGYGGQLNG